MWEIVDESDPLGPTRYTAEPWAGRGGGIAVMAHRERCKAWRLGVYPTLGEAKAATDEWIASCRADREARKQESL